MTKEEVIDLIQLRIIANGNEEITADVLRPILEAMVNQPNDLIGDLDNLTTTYQTDLVGAINEINALISSSGLVIYTGTDLPDVHSFPTVLTPADFYVQLDGSTVLGMWVYNGNDWIPQIPQRTKTVKKFVSLVGVTVAGKSQVQWMAEAINLNISNGAVYECEDGDIIDFFVNVSTSVTVDAASIRRIYTRLCTGATSVTSVVANDLMPDGSEEIPVTGDLIIELGDIGTDDVWDAFNADPSQPFDMDNEMFVSAVQDSEPKLWQWIGGTGSFGSTGTPAVEDDFLDLTLQPVVTIGQLYDPYLNISSLLSSQLTQSTETIIRVLDASADTNITFAIGETKLQAYYEYLGTPNGLISDYRLVSVPYGNHSAYTEGQNITIEDNVIDVDIPEFVNVSSLFASLGTPPRSIVADSLGNIYTANSIANNVSKVTPEGVVSVFAATGNNPYDICVDSLDNVYTINSSNITKITPAGTPSVFASVSGGISICVDSLDNLYVARYSTNNVSKITPAGTVTTFATVGTNPNSICADINDNIYTANYGSNNVSKITPAGTSSILGTTGSIPVAIVSDSLGNIYTANGVSLNVSKITQAGVSTIVATVTAQPFDITVDSNDNIFVSDNDELVTKITQAGVSSVFGTTGSNPEGICVDSLDNVYTANLTGGSITKITLDADRILSVNTNKEIIRTYIPHYQAGTNVIIDFTDPRFPIINGIGQSAHTGTVIPLDKINGSANNTATWNATYTLGAIIEGGSALDIIDTTGEVAFPSITGATLLTGSAFEADKIFEMHTYTTDGANAFYYFLIRE